MLSKFSVKKPFTVLVAIILVLILGAVSYTKMTVDLIPSINLPYAVVVTTYIGASPEQVETVVTDSLEQTLASVDNMKSIQSVSAENMSLIILEFNDDTNMDSAVLEMRESLDMITAYFPEEIGSPMIMKINPDMMPVEIITASVEGMSPEAAAVYIEDKIIPEIKSVEGVASATATGLIENFVDITISEDKISQLNQKIDHYAEEQLQSAIDEQVEAIYSQQMANPQTPPDLSNLSPEELAAMGDMLLSSAIPSEEDIKAQIREQVEAEIAKSSPEMDIPDMSDTITVEMLKGILSAQNFSMPAGSTTNAEGTTHMLRVGDKYQSADELSKQVIFEMDGIGNVTIGDIAKVFSYDNTSMVYAKVNGRQAVMLSLQKQPNYSTAEVTSAVGNRLDEISANNPDVYFDILMNQGDYVNLMISSIVKNLLLGALFAIIVLYIFLRKVRSTLIVAASIVISVITTFVLMYIAGISLNMISMGGLALGVGMLVDNSIVVIENIFRMRANGCSRREAAIEGTKQVAGAITASTITTIVVFVPIIFTTGITKELFTDMALTIGFSLIASLLVALTLVPVASASFLSDKMEFKKNFSDKLSEGYSKFLGNALNHKAITVLVVVALLGGSIAGALSSGVELFPTMDSGSITVTVNIPEKYSREERFSALDELNETLLSVKDVKTVGIMDTSDSTDAEGAMLSMMSTGTSVYLLLDEDKSRTTNEVIKEIRQKTEGKEYEVTVSSSNADLSMLAGDSVSIRIMGRELDDIRQVASDIADIVTSTEGTVEVNNGLSRSSDELRVIVDKDKAMKQGLTVAQVYMAVQSKAANASVATSFDVDGVSYSVYVKDERDGEFTAEELENITIANQSGEDVLITDIAEIQTTEGFASIMRTNQERTITVTAGLADGYDVADVNSKIADKIAEYQMPTGCRFEMGGESETIKDTFTDLALMILLAVVFIYLVMVAQFQSLLFPFIVMFTIPLAFTGGFGALFITGTPVSVISLIGLVVLVGIVVNNGIVFVDYANQQVASGMTVREALITTGSHRLRPILMTAITTIIALVGMAFDTSMGSEMLKPIAITTIGGMLYSTLLTLIFIPTMYSIFRKDKAKKVEVDTTAISD